MRRVSASLSAEMNVSRPGADAPGDQVERRLTDVLARTLRGLDVGGVVDAGARIWRRLMRWSEEVALGHHAQRTPSGSTTSRWRTPWVAISRAAS